MHLRTQIYKSNLPKVLVVFLLLGLFPFYSNTLFADNHSAYSYSSPAKNSRKKAKQFDTLFCAQKPIAKIIQLKTDKDSFATYYYYHINDTSLLLSVKPMVMQTVATTNQSKIYYHFEFPNIQMNADYKLKAKATKINDIICEFLLINKDGLDTVKAEMFATINGNIQSQAGKKIDAEKLFIVERNKSAEIKIEELEISQDGILLGRYEEEELEGPNGKFIQYSIFNSTGALVCIASKVKFIKDRNTVQWNLLTQKDMRFSTTELKSGDDIIELLKYLVQKSII